MIQDVDESLRALVKRDALNGSKADVAFDAPTKEWSSRRNTPTVDLYLYDIREDLEQREVMWQDIRGDARDPRLVTERRPPPRRFKLSYLVTAWTQRPEDEHRLLSALLGCFLRHPTMPADALSGTLVDSRQPITLNIALPPPQDRSISDVWSALGGELKPSLDLVVNAPFEIKVAIAAGPPVLEEPKLSFAGSDGETDEAVGSAARPAKGRRGAAAAEDAKPVGTPGPGGPKASGRLKPGEPANKPGVAPDQEETVRSGKEKQPGRILRVRGVNRS
jgi:Pvc16 N-terminal domain